MVPCYVVPLRYAGELTHLPEWDTLTNLRTLPAAVATLPACKAQCENNIDCVAFTRPVGAQANDSVSCTFKRKLEPGMMSTTFDTYIVNPGTFSCVTPNSSFTISSVSALDLAYSGDSSCRCCLLVGLLQACVARQIWRRFNCAVTVDTANGLHGHRAYVTRTDDNVETERW